ncbi:unnamed protein product, partial [marine sediment metagenome]
MKKKIIGMLVVATLVIISFLIDILPFIKAHPISPFDKIARYYHNTVWLVEVKTMIKKFGYTPGITQKKRMKEVLKRLKQKGKEIQPILIQIRLGTGDYIVRYF